MSIAVKSLSKSFGHEPVVNDVSFRVETGELFVLIGASGSGKSTILRLIAGLLTPDAGSVALFESDVTRLPPQKRNVGFVFQNHSLFKHLTVAENVAFGLKLRKVPHKQRGERTAELLELVGLAGFGHRLPHHLSGGQSQRVAVARALAYEPAVLLLDEPFGALDVKIRSHLRQSLKEIQEKLKVTTVLVTHDQEEAFELAHRIAVLEHGHVLSIGKPRELYATPKDDNTACFLGRGFIFVLTGENAPQDRLHIGDALPADSARVLVRPEDVVAVPSGPSGTDRFAERTGPDSGSLFLGEGRVIARTYLGATTRLTIQLRPQPWIRQVMPPVPFGAEGPVLECLIRHDRAAERDDGIGQHVSVWATHYHSLHQGGLKVLTVKTPNASTPHQSFLKACEHFLPGSKVHEGYPDLPMEQLESWTERERSEFVERLAGESSEHGYQLVALSEQAVQGRAGSALCAHLLSRYFVLMVPRNVGRPQHMLLCTRGGEPGKTDVALTARLAKRFGAKVTVLHLRPESELGPEHVRAHLSYACNSLRALGVDCADRLEEIPSNRTIATRIEQLAGELACDVIVVGAPLPENREHALEGLVSSLLSESSFAAVVIPFEPNS